MSAGWFDEVNAMAEDANAAWRDEAADASLDYDGDPHGDYEGYVPDVEPEEYRCHGCGLLTPVEEVCLHVEEEPRCRGCAVDCLGCEVDALDATAEELRARRRLEGVWA